MEHPSTWRITPLSKRLVKGLQTIDTTCPAKPLVIYLSRWADPHDCETEEGSSAMATTGINKLQKVTPKKFENYIMATPRKMFNLKLYILSDRKTGSKFPVP